MKKNHMIRTALTLLIAFTMTFAPVFSSFAAASMTSGSGDQETEAEAEVQVEEAGSQTSESDSEESVPDAVQQPEEDAQASPESEPQESQPQPQKEEVQDEPVQTEEPAEEADSEEPAAEPEEPEEEEASKTEYEWEDSKVKVKAVLSDASAVPDDAELVVAPITEESKGYNYSAYMDALNEGSDASYTDANTMLYDVAFIKDGVEIEPAGKVSVTFEFLDSQLAESIGADKASDVNVIHLPLKDNIKDKYDTTADAKKIDSGDIEVEPLTSEDNDLRVSVKNEKVVFNTDSFSVFAYTVDFEYTDPETGKAYYYNLEGEGSVTLRNLAVILGITTKENADAFIDNVEKAEFSDESLVRVQKTLLRGWVLKSLAPFSSNETLTITMKDGETIIVNVTDNQISSDLTNFLSNVVISGATQNSDGAYEVEQGKEYSIILSFAESSDYQFYNDHTLTYKMPDGVKVLTEQNGPLAINIVYKGRTYQVDASYHLDTAGNLSVDIDQNDPDFPRLVDSTNVSFRFTYNAQFNGTTNKIHFSEDIERDIVFDEPEPGQAFAQKSAVYDEKSGTFHYTITVTATGDVTDVNVKDTITGDAIVFNSRPADAIEISGNSSTYTIDKSNNGFDITFDSMKEGEVITIKYDATVDFTKDSNNDGKLTVDQTKNSVSVQPEGGDPHNSEYSREITFKSTDKGNGTEVGTTENGDKIIEWQIDYNPLALASAAGDTITDRISAASAQYMKYYGDGLSIKAYDSSGNLAMGYSVPYTELTSYSDDSWTYTIPDSHTTPYHYVITYQTIVDMKKVKGGGTSVTLDNTANNDGSSIHVSPGAEIEVVKEAETFTTEEVNWVSTLSIPEGGLDQAVVTDTLPTIYLNGANHYDAFKEGSLDVQGLLPGESYDVSVQNDKVVITFYKDEAKSQTGLQAHDGGHNITVRLTTKVDQEWLQKGYETGSYEQNHVNTIALNGKSDTAVVTFGEPGIKKTGDVTTDWQGNVSFKYTVLLSGVSDVPVSVKDTFDTDLLEVDTSKATEWDHMQIWGGNQYSQHSGKTAISYSDASDGIILTANSVPMQADGNYYPYYKIIYYLKLKPGVDLEQLAIANGGEYDIVNNAKWGDHETSYTYKTKYDFLDKQLLNEGQLGGTDRTAQYQITFNRAKATLNGGEPMKMEDVLSSNLSVDYSSISITTEPAGVSVPYSLSGGKDGTTIATYTVPDSTKVVITYNAEVRGDGNQHIVNKVSVKGEEETIENTKSYGSASEGEGAVASFKIVKVDGYDANKKLSGVRFRIFAENQNINFGAKANYAKQIVLTTDENGEITLDGNEYDFYFNEIYHVQEVAPPDNYGSISFDYLVTLTNDMSHVDYGHYIYYFSDTMQIKNWPLEGLIVEKQVESDDDADKERYYTFRMSILNKDGTVNTDYNEKNGDDQFENGVVEFQIKDKEQKMFWGFDKGTRYKVEEIDADGFATTVTYSIFDEEGNVTETRTDSATSHSGELTQEDEVIIFRNSKTTEKGSLSVKKAVNGLTTEKEFEFTVRQISGGKYVQDTDGTLGDDEHYFSIKNGEVVNISNLPVGEYEVEENVEDAAIDGYSLIASGGGKVTVLKEGSTVNLINSYTQEFGSLKISKAVSGSDLPSDIQSKTFQFTVKQADGDLYVQANGSLGDQPHIFTVTPSTETTIENIPHGKYVIDEIDASAKIDGYSWTVTGEDEVDVAEDYELDDDPDFTIVTPCDTTLFELDDLGKDLGFIIVKRTGGTEHPWVIWTQRAITTAEHQMLEALAEEEFPSFKESRCEYVHGLPYSYEGGVFSITEVDGSTDIVFRDESEWAQFGYGKYTASATPAEGTLVNTYTQETGSLKIRKNVTVNGAATTGTEADGVYTFQVKDSTGAVKATKTITITNGVSNEVTVSGLVPGTYTVSEDVDQNPVGMSLTGDNDIEVAVAAGEEAEVQTAAFTNDKTETGSLKIRKSVTVNSDATETTLADGEYEFQVKDSTGAVKATKTITITDGVSDEVTVDNLVPGTYTITETDPENGTVLVGDNNKTVVVTANNTADIPTAAFVNNRDVGSLEITKNVTVNGQAASGTLADGTYSFTVKDKDGNAVATTSITITNGRSNTATVENLAAGVYTVTESAPDNGTVLVGDNDRTVTVTAGRQAQVATVAFTNDLEYLGSLKIKKNVTLNGAETTETDADGTYTFNITGPGNYSDSITLTVTGGVSAEEQIDRLLPGDYTVTEVISEDAVTRLLATDNPQTITVEGNNTADIPTAEFTNNFAKESVTFEGVKAFKYGKFPEGVNFEFEVYDKAAYDAVKALDNTTTMGGAAAAPAATGETGELEPGDDGKIHFETTAVTYTYADIGVHEYVIVEKIPDTADENGYDRENDIKYDKTVRNVKVTVSEDAENPGRLKVVKEYEDGSAEAAEFTNEKIFTELELTKSIDKLVAGDSKGELVNVTLVFRVRYTDPITDKPVDRTVSVQFDKDKVSAETAVLTRIPIETTDLTVEEIYTAGYEGTVGPVQKEVNEDGTPVFSVQAENRNPGDTTGSGVINTIDKNTFGIKSRRDSTGKNPDPAPVADETPR